MPIETGPGTGRRRARARGAARRPVARRPALDRLRRGAGSVPAGDHRVRTGDRGRGRPALAARSRRRDDPAVGDPRADARALASRLRGGRARPADLSALREPDRSGRARVSRDERPSQAAGLSDPPPGAAPRRDRAARAACRTRPTTPSSPLPPRGRRKRSAIYKPRRGETPLWDFPDGTLHLREVAAYRVARELGWPNVPPTVAPTDAPEGPGSVQLFRTFDPEQHYFTLEDERPDDFRQDRPLRSRRQQRGPQGRALPPRRRRNGSG